jgi:hypothetical protein
VGPDEILGPHLFDLAVQDLSKPQGFEQSADKLGVQNGLKGWRSWRGCHESQGLSDHFPSLGAARSKPLRYVERCSKPVSPDFSSIYGKKPPFMA